MVGRAVLGITETTGRTARPAPMGKYIGWEALKLLALVLHAIYGQIYPKYSEHGQRKMIIPQKMTIITIAKALGYTYREMETLARELREVLGIKLSLIHI